MTPKERAAMQQALEALEELFHSNSTKVAVEKYNTAHNDLREALAEQAEQEPVAWGCVVDGELEGFVPTSQKDINRNKGVYETPLYDAPVRTKDLTDDEIEAIRIGIIAYEPTGYGRVFARAVIAADREKNK